MWWYKIVTSGRQAANPEQAWTRTTIFESGAQQLATDVACTIDTTTTQGGNIMDYGEEEQAEVNELLHLVNNNSAYDPIQARSFRPGKMIDSPNIPGNSSITSGMRRQQKLSAERTDHQQTLSVLLQSQTRRYADSRYM